MSLVTDNIKLSPQEYLEKIETILINKKFNIGYYMELDKIFVHIGSNEDYNMNYIIKHNYLYKKLNRSGGTIVGFSGDVEYIYFLPKNKYFGEVPEIVSLLKFLQYKNLNATISQNDILVDGYKVASWATADFEDRLLITIVVSMNVDLNIIKNICTKPMKKIPKGLTEFGIASNDIKKLFKLELE